MNATDLAYEPLLTYIGNSLGFARDEISNYPIVDARMCCSVVGMNEAIKQ